MEQTLHNLGKQVFPLFDGMHRFRLQAERFPQLMTCPDNSRLHSLFKTRKGEQAYETDHL